MIRNYIVKEEKEDKVNILGNYEIRRRKNEKKKR